MWFGKNIMTKLGLALALAVPAFAAEPVAPFTFKNATSDKERDAFWEELMSYKIWGTNSILMARAQAPDTLGGIGTTGNLVLVNEGHVLGGPILVGKSITTKAADGDMCQWTAFDGNQEQSDNYCNDDNKGHDKFYKGPVRVNGTFNAGQNTNEFYGTYCVGSANGYVDHEGSMKGDLNYGPPAPTSGACDFKKVKEVPLNLTVPTYSSLPADTFQIEGINVPENGVYEIDVPPVKNGKKMYDYYINGSVKFTNAGHLKIRLQSTSSLARFFIKNTMYFTSASKIQVFLVDKGAEYNYTTRKWTKVTKDSAIVNKDYVGNLLFYCNDPLVWTAASNGNENESDKGAFFQGTFMSKEYIAVKSNLTLAGQFIASNLIIGNEFNGKNFRYVQFDQPVVKLPTASDNGIIIYEGNTTPDNIEIVLDKASGAGVTFQYCFEFTGNNIEGEDEASCQDVGNGKACANNTIPWYNATTNECVNPLHSGFNPNETTLNSPITLQAFNDDFLEKDLEHFRIRIMKLDGAVLEGGDHDGFLDLYVKDDDSKPLGKNIVVAGIEDVPYKFEAFTVTNSSGAITYTDYSVKIEKLPAKGTLVLVKNNGASEAVKENGKISSADIAAGKFVFNFEKDDYTEPTQTDYHRYDFEFRVLDSHGNVSDLAYTATVTVAPVNDAPVASKTVFKIPEKSVSTAASKTYAESEASDKAFDATDVDDPKDALTYKFDDNFGAGYTEENYNHVTSLYGIEENTGKIYVKEGAELDYESADRELSIRVVITDKSTSTGLIDDAMSTTVEAVIKITDVNEPPVAKDLEVTLYEVTPKSPIAKDSVIGQVEAVDPDSLSNGLYDYLEYYLDKNADVPFAVNKLTGEVSVKDPAKLDYEDATIVDHKFVFDVVVKNCVLDATTRKPTDVCLEDVSTVTIELKNVNEPPIVIDSTGDTISVAENSPVGLTKMAYFEVTDPDEEDNANLLTQIVPNITDNKKKSGVVSAEDLFEMVMEKAKDKNGVDKYWAVLKVKADLDFEAIMAARGDSVFDVTLTFTDQAGAGLDTSLAKKIAVTDVNEEPYFTEAGPFDVKENSPVGTPIGEVKAADDDIKEEYNTLYYTIPVNEDSDPDNDVPFAIVNIKSGLITVANKEALDFEDPSILEHKFEFKVQVSDGEYKKDTLVTITLVDDDEPPHIIPECEGDKCIEICKGDKCEVCEGESCHETCTENCNEPRNPAKVLTVTVDENSPTGFEIINYAVSDEDLLVNHTKLEVLPFDNTNNSGADALFNVEVKPVSGKWRLIVSVKDRSKLDFEKIKEIHELTIYVRDHDDPDGMYDSLLRVIKVVDVNEAPTITGVEDLNSDYKGTKDDFTFYPKEDLAAGGSVGYVHTEDPDILNMDEFGYREFSLDNPNNYPFEMKDSLLVLTKKLDYEKDPKEYTFKVIVNNCERVKNSAGKYEKKDPPKCVDPVTQTVTVKLQDVNEKPTIIVDGPTPDGGDDSEPFCIAHCDTTGRGVTKTDTLTIGVRENLTNLDGTMDIVSPTGMVLFTYHYADEDAGHVAGATVDWIDVGSSIPSKETKGSDLFKLDYKNGEITVSVKDAKLLDYETLRNAEKRIDPDPEYTMKIVVTDPQGLADTLYRIIRVTDENEAPGFEAETCIIVEGRPKGDSVGRIMHPIDYDSLSRDSTFYNNEFEKTDGTDFFHIESDDGWLLKLVSDVELNCESGEYDCDHDGKYSVTLNYYDPRTPEIKHQGIVPVRLIDLNEDPVIETDTIGVDENSPAGTLVDTIAWSDVDRFDSVMHFEITKDPSGCFAIDKNTGVVTVKKNNCSNLDFEKNEYIEIYVAITDMVNVTDTTRITGGPNTVEKKIRVNVHDVNEPPSITDKTITVKEDTKPKTVVDTVRATDPDKNPEYRDLTYTLIGGDTATFKIEPKTGALILKDTLDYETKSSYYVTVRVDDGEFADTAKVKINIGNVKEWSKVKITEAESKRKNWEDPDVIYTNETIHKICWTQDGDEVCKEGLKIAKDTTIIVEWKNPTKDYAGRDTLRIYYSNSIPSVTVTGKKTLVDADNVFTIVEDMGEADTNIYINKSRDSIWVKIKDPASKLDTAIGIEVSLGPVEASKIQGSLDKMTKVADSKIMRDETAKNVVETLVNRNQYKYTYKEIVGKDTVKVSYMTDKDGEPIKVPVINEKGKVDSVEVITVTYTTTIDGKEVEVSYQADALTGEVFVKGPAGELMEQGASKKIYDSDKNSKSGNSVTEGMFTITTGGKDILGNDRVISYAVDKNGKMVKNTEGDVGYSVIYSYMNKYGNVATESVFIVVDQVGPKVEILSPVNKEVVRSNSVKVVWTVDGVEQDTLNLQGLSKGPNVIVRFYRDKAGNEDSAVVYVYMKDSKDVEISVEQPVTEISKDKIEEYYAVNPPEKGETFAVSIRNPTTGEEVETLIGGSFKTKEGSGKEPYPGVSGSSQHLGPTLAMDIKVPVIDGVAGLATLDDLITPDGLIALERTDAKKAHKITVEEYVQEFCEDGFKIPSDVSQVNLFDTKLKAQIWVYTSLGNFVDYFSFTQELNDPNYTDEAGLLKMYFEMKPDKDGFVKADNGKQYATGAFVYKVQATIHSKARCTIPDNTYDPENKKNCDAKERDCDGYGETTKRKGDNIKNSDELLKSFGYRRPKNK